MKKPNGWYMFHWECPQHHYRNTNMSPESQNSDCKRKDKKGNIRKSYDFLKCHWSVCPRLKTIRKQIKLGKLQDPVDLNEGMWIDVLIDS